MALLLPYRQIFVAVWILPALLLAVPVGAAHLTIPIASQLDRGWFDSAGNASPTNAAFGFGGNYTVGMSEVEYRNFFIFELPVITEPILGAAFVIYCTAPEDGGYVSADTTETFVLVSIDTTTIEALRNRDTYATNPTVFEDLGLGTLYSDSTLFSATNQGTEVTIPLNEHFLAALTNNLGGTIAFGGRLVSIWQDPPIQEFLFAYSHHVPFDRTRLVLTLPDIPQLTVTRNPDATLQLSWPAEFREYLLEYTDNLTFPDWTAALLPRDEIDGQVSILIDPSASQQFYRLRENQ